MFKRIRIYSEKEKRWIVVDKEYAKEIEKENEKIKKEENELEAERIEKENRKREEKFINVILTTAPTLSNQKIEKELEIISAECVYGINIFRDFFASITDIVGGRSEATQNVLKDARKAVIEELKKEAVGIGADAVIGVDLDYQEISGSGKSMLFLVASGTAVKIKK